MSIGGFVITGCVGNSVLTIIEGDGLGVGGFTLMMGVVSFISSSARFSWTRESVSSANAVAFPSFVRIPIMSSRFPAEGG
jgi:Na+/melibiose symporter-like transporter